MKRRTFIQTGGMAALALSSASAWARHNHPEYTVEELMGKADINLHGADIQLRKPAHDDFLRMQKAAATEGIDIKIVSSYRSFERQEMIFERKYIRFTEEDGMEPLQAIDKIIEYSTIPGTSRHHWGTDIDIIDGSKESEGDVLVTEKFREGGEFEDLKKWMDANARQFGFYLVYTDEPRRRGFKYEPWHYSYGRLSRPMLSSFRRKNILRLLEAEQFLGADHFTTGFINTYIRDNILDINAQLL